MACGRHLWRGFVCDHGERSHRAMLGQDEKAGAILRTYWQADSLKVLSSSSASPEASRNLLELISFSESSATGSCKNLMLMKVEPGPLVVFTIAGPDGVYRKYAPQQFLEYWYVDACGEKHRWRVFDAADTPGRVMALRYANYAKPAAKGAAANRN